MGFLKSYRRPILLIVLSLSVFSWPATVGAVTPPTKKPPVSKAAPKKPAPPVAKKADVRPSYSLEGKVFDRISDNDRLSSADAARYAHIFAFQDVNDLKKANDEIGHLDDHRLMGHVLLQRYLGKGYRASYNELAGWMKRYGDHPGAQKIYSLALARRPAKGAMPLERHRLSKGALGYHELDSGQAEQPYLSAKTLTPYERDVVAGIRRGMSSGPSSALSRLQSASGLFSDKKYDALRAEIAEAFFYHGNLDQAYRLAAASSDRSGREVPLAGWIAGLCSWKMGKYGEAARHFERTANSARSSSWMSAAGAHWAARSYLRNRQPQKVGYWLRHAAEHPRTFYGIISVKALGMEQSRFNWELPDLNGDLVEVLSKVPAGLRALPLMDARNSEMAEQELKQISPRGDTALQEAMIALAHKSGAPAFQMRLGSGLKDRNKNLYDAALYPDSPWEPEGGWQVDKALVHAFIRQESKFESGVRNRSSGALGIMQLMPSTARILARRHGLRVSIDQLRDPATNIRLGQNYLGDLLKEPIIKNNLFKLTVAYNAGPGKLSRWEKEVKYNDDPLLFVESIPIAETRSFLERVLTNYWIYRLKYGKNTDSLEQVASGEWPIHTE